MNCFTHALPFLDDPYMAVACCIPDWLSAADRKCRAREKKAAPFAEHNDPIVATIARGVVQHHRDDDWFHRTVAFNEMSMAFTLELRDIAPGGRGMRAGLVGHIIIELFLDAYLHQQNPGKLGSFYDLVDGIDEEKLQDSVNLFTTRPTERLVWYVNIFRTERYLFDYSSDEGTIYRINKVLGRIKLPLLGDNGTEEKILAWLPGVRKRVYNRAGELLEGYPLHPGSP